jgi:hypothetical protein
VRPEKHPIIVWHDYDHQQRLGVKELGETLTEHVSDRARGTLVTRSCLFRFIEETLSGHVFSGQNPWAE